MWRARARLECTAELHDELQGRCGEQPPTLDNLDELPLLDAVTKEAMRLFPPLPFLVRRVHVEAELSGFPVRPRDYVLLSIYNSHRDPEVFPDPDKVLLDRAACDNNPE